MGLAFVVMVPDVGLGCLGDMKASDEFTISRRDTAAIKNTSVRKEKDLLTTPVRKRSQYLMRNIAHSENLCRNIKIYYGIHGSAVQRWLDCFAFVPEFAFVFY
jgi:hypothetical protein